MRTVTCVVPGDTVKLAAFYDSVGLKTSDSHHISKPFLVSTGSSPSDVKRNADVFMGP